MEPEPDFQSLYFAEPNAQGGVSQPFEVLRAGQYVKGGRKLQVTEAHLDQMVSNFEALKQRGGEVPIDKDHSFAMGQGSEAAGWVKELVRKGRSLFARVKWTKDASDAIRSEKYRYISAEFDQDWRDEFGEKKGAALLAAGLTNRPFLRGLTPVALSEEIQENDVRFLVPAVGTEGSFSVGGVVHPNSDVAWLRPGEQLIPGAPTFTTSRTAVSPVSVVLHGPGDTRSEVAETLTVEINGEEQKLSAEKVAELFTELAETKTKLDEATEKLDEAKEAAKGSEKLTERLESVEKDLATERFAADFKQAQREGRVDAADETREKWERRYEKYGRDDAREMLFELPAETIPVSERGSGVGKESDAAPEGVDPDDFKLNQRVEALMAENSDLTFDEALAKAEAA